MLRKVIAKIIPLILFAASISATPDIDGAPHVRRYLLSAGANNGGKDRVMLRYAVSDAKAFAAVLVDMGGVEKDNALILSNPNSRELLGGIANLGKLAAGDSAALPAAKSEVFVYYSGHADESGLKLGGETLSWADFRNAVSGLGADVRVAVLDACGSGAITRTKGGVARPAFLSDASSNMKGYAFLTSSNENEASQESDRIKGSYFTYALLSGMRGAADMTGDGKVTINEAYQYAFNETLQNTQNTRAGTQHPSRDMNLAGTGDVVMTDLRETSATLSLHADIEGRFFIRDEQGNLFAELRKPRGRGIELGMPPGRYSVQMEAPSKMWMANEIEITEGKKTTLTMNDMTAMEAKTTRARGDSGEDTEDTGDAEGIPDSADISGAPAPQDSSASTASSQDSLPPTVPTEPARDSLSSSTAAAQTPRPFIQSLMSSLLPPRFDPPPPPPPNPLLDSACRSPYRTNADLLFAHSDGPESGVQFSLIMNDARAEFCGTQLSLVLNRAGRDMNGTQLSIINLLNGRGGVVQAGLLNVAAGGITGIQAGAVNIAGGSAGYVQGGALNVAKRVEYIQAGYANLAACAGGQAGSFNAAGSVKYVQGGAANIAGNVGAVQGGAANIAGNVGYIQGGAANIAGKVGYVQAGAANIAGKVGYVQAGAANVAGHVEHIQAGSVNIAGKAGRQIGVVNIAGYSEKTPIGLINIIGNGIFDAAFYVDACGDMGASFHTGTAYLYTVFDYQQPIADFDVWPKAWGWGLGTRFGMGAPFFINMDAVWSSVLYAKNFGSRGAVDEAGDEAGAGDEYEWGGFDADRLVKLRFGANYRPLPFIAVTAGVSVNALFNTGPDWRDRDGDGDGVEDLPRFNRGGMWCDWRLSGRREARVWPSVYAGLTVGRMPKAAKP